MWATTEEMEARFTICTWTMCLPIDMGAGHNEMITFHINIVSVYGDVGKVEALI